VNLKFQSGIGMLEFKKQEPKLDMSMSILDRSNVSILSNNSI
jgi:hypothetical protein